MGGEEILDEELMEGEKCEGLHTRADGERKKVGEKLGGGKWVGREWKGASYVFKSGNASSQDNRTYWVSNVCNIVPFVMTAVKYVWFYWLDMFIEKTVLVMRLALINCLHGK